MSTNLSASQCCVICNLPSSRRCVQCRSSSYCSPECQQTDWPAHKYLCDTLRSFPLIPHNPLSTNSLRRCILFPADDKAPRFAYINCIKHEDKDDGPWERADMGDLLGNDSPTSGYGLIQRNVRNGRNIGHSITVVYRDAFLMDGSKLNKSIIEVTRGAARHSWMGPIVAIRYANYGGFDHMRYPMRYHDDMTMSDYRDVVDYFASYGDPNNDPDSMVGSRIKVKGVMINCRGDQVVLKQDEFVSVSVPIDHPIFFLAPESSIAKALELPLLIRKCPPNKVWKNDASLCNDAYRNQSATFLHLDADSNSSWWGWAPLKWQNNVGSTLVVRQDRKDLLPQHVQALSAFAIERLQPLFQDSLEGVVSKEEVLTAMTRKKFEAFLQQYGKIAFVKDPSRKNKIPQNKAKANVVSPYSV